MSFLITRARHDAATRARVMRKYTSTARREKYTSTARRVTNLVKKAEAVTGAELRVGIVTIYQHHSCPQARTDPSLSPLLSNLSI